MKILLCIDRWKIWYKLPDVKPLLNVKRSIEIGNCPTPKNIKRVTESVHNSTLIY